MFTESSLKMLPILTSDSHDDVPDEWSWYNDSSDSEEDEIGVLTHSPTPCEFNDNNQGLSLLEWRIEAVFSFLCQGSSQDHLLGHTPCSPSFWVHFAYNERIEEVHSHFLSLRKSLILTQLFWKRLVFSLCVLLGPWIKILVHHWRLDIP